MCFVKSPKMKTPTPAAAPPPPEESAAEAQGIPEAEDKQANRKTPSRNKLRIDLKAEESKFSGQRLNSDDYKSKVQRL